ncbi:MAG TPA: hypothetical protein VL173_14035 [Vicinamibacterales bacterium]|jgi:hypothetical protein|nr:hypothetical protein [Vicinamibacterales bacterium]
MVNPNATVLDTPFGTSPFALRTMGTECAAFTGVSLDRKKHDFDVMERVLGAVRDHDVGSHTDVVSVDIKPWTAGVTSSVVQLTVAGDPHRNRSEDDH